MKIKKLLRKLPVKLKLLCCYLPSMLLVLAATSLAVYLLLRVQLTRCMEADLRNAVSALQNIIETTVNMAATENLRLFAEKDLDLLETILEKQPDKKKAKEEARRLLASQKIGRSGYIYAINSLGIIEAHPNKEMIGEDISGYGYVAEQKKRKYGYLEYEWMDNSSCHARLKALHMAYFSPWDWIISATAYKDEFYTLIKGQLLERSVTSLREHSSGHSFVLDRKGQVLARYPNDMDDTIFQDKELIAEITTRKNGQITYSFPAKSGDNKHKWFAVYQNIPTFGWTVVSAADLDECYSPLATARIIIFCSLLGSGLLVLLLTWQVSDMITKPLKYLMRGMQAASAGDYSQRLRPTSADEPGRLEAFFNTFIAKLQESSDRLNQSEKDFRAIFENSVEGIFEFDLNGTILKVNPSFVAMLGFDNGDSLLAANLNLKKNVLVKKELWNNLIEQIISEGAVKGFEMQIYRKSGAVYWCLLNARKIQEVEGTGRTPRVEGFLSDIDAQKSAQESQQKMMEDLEKIVAERTVELSDRIAELEQRNQINKHLGRMADMLQSCRCIDEVFPVIKQYLKNLFPHDSCYLYLHSSSTDNIEQLIPPPTESDIDIPMTNESCWALRQGKKYLFRDMETELACSHVDIDRINDGYLCIPLTAHGNTIGLLHITFGAGEQMDDATVERKSRLGTRLAEHLSLAIANLKLQEELKQKSIQDALTGLSNRRHMEEVLLRQLSRMLRHKTPCSVIMLDVDHFKSFNDTYGHDIGDCILRELGSYLRKTTRGEDLPCRYGGEEFTIILADTETEQAVKKAERIRKDVEEIVSIMHQSTPLHITVSLGVATGPAHGTNIDDLLKEADKALYRAKEGGRNRVEVAGNDE